MRKKIILYLSIVLTFPFLPAFSQCWNTENTVTTDWRDPGTVNTWDWTQPMYDNLYIVDPNAAPSDPVTPASVQSPFIDPNGLANNLNLLTFVNAYSNHGIKGVDFMPEDGWELMAKNFGTCCTQSQAVNEPFFALYNRATGTIRLFLLKVYSPAATYNGVSIKMSFISNGRESALLSHSFPICKTVVEFEKDIVMQTPNNYTDDNYFWFFADFPAAYDPCTCDYPSQLNVSYDYIISADVKLEGDLVGTIRQVIDNTNNVNTADGEKTIADWAKKIGTDVKAVSKVYTQWNGFKTQADKFIDKNKADLKLSMTTELEALKNYTKYLPYVGAVVGIFDLFIGGGKKSEEQKQPTPLAFETHQHLTLTGSITTTAVASDNIFWTPGSNPGALTAKPTYDNILGTLNILEPPLINYVQYDINSLVYTSEPSIRQYKLSGPLKYVLNPAAHLRVKSIDAAYIIKYKDAGDPVLPYNVPHLEVLGLSLGYLQSAYPHPVEFGMPSQTYINMPLKDRMNRAGFEFEQFPNTWPTNQSYAILRTPYVPISCFDQQSFFLYHPLQGTPPLEINIKIVARLERTDDPDAQDVLFVCTYKPQFGTSTSGVYDIQHDYGVPNSYPLVDPLYPTNLRAYGGGPIGALLPYSPWVNTPMDLKFENTTITSDKTAMNTITIGNNVTISSGVTIKAGKNIDILPTNLIDPTVVFKIGYDEVACGNAPSLNHNSNAEITTFCANNSDYENHSARISKVSDNVNEKEFPMSVYPNPSKGVFNFNPLDYDVEYHLELFNNVGIKLFDGNFTGLFKLDMTHYTKGIYLVKTTTEEFGQSYHKIVLN